MEILEICADLKIGGAQRVAANIAKYASDDNHFVYAVFDPDVGDYEAEILNGGHEVVRFAPPRKRRRFISEFTQLLRSKQFDVVHCHTMYSCGLVMLIAWLHRVPGRISHSHTALDQASGRSSWRTLYKGLMRELIWLFGTDYLACGRDAGEELYGKRRFSEKGVIVKNGIDTERYRFSETNRKQIRAKYQLENRFVIGHVGHYETVKNQLFLIRRMPEVIRARPDAVLLLFGEGSTRSGLETEIENLGLASHVRVMGNVNNIPAVLSSFDVFAFPSLFEGTPLALIEAQANGLPCVISDQVPQDACVTDLIRTLPLDDAAKWVQAILAAERDRETDHTAALLSHYEDIHESMAKLYEIFDRYKNRR